MSKAVAPGRETVAVFEASKAALKPESVSGQLATAVLTVNVRGQPTLVVRFDTITVAAY